MMVLAVVGFGVFVAADDLTVVTTMLRPIIGDLGIVLPDGLDDAAWIVNAYLVAYVAVMPFMGRLSDLLGRRRVYIGGLTVFLIGSIIIPMSSSLAPFLVGRVLTAIGGGALVPIGMAVVGDAFAEQRRARALGTLGAIDTLGWVWGPLFGAFLVRFLSWEWQFYLNIPLALIGIAAAWWALADVAAPSATGRIDWIGAVALTGALTSLNLALLGSAEVQSVTGLDQLTGSTGKGLRWLFVPVLFLAVFFVWWQRRSRDPLIDPELFRGRNLSAAVAVNFFVGAALVIAMVDVPIFVNAVEGDLERSAVIAGWVLTALTAAMVIGGVCRGSNHRVHLVPASRSRRIDGSCVGLPAARENLGGRYLSMERRVAAGHPRCGVRSGHRPNQRRSSRRGATRPSRHRGKRGDGPQADRTQCRS